MAALTDLQTGPQLGLQPGSQTKPALPTHCSHMAAPQTTT